MQTMCEQLRLLFIQLCWVVYAKCQIVCLVMYITFVVLEHLKPELQYYYAAKMSKFQPVIRPTSKVLEPGHCTL